MSFFHSPLLIHYELICNFFIESMFLKIGLDLRKGLLFIFMRSNKTTSTMKEVIL